VGDFDCCHRPDIKEDDEDNTVHGGGIAGQPEELFPLIDVPAPVRDKLTKPIRGIAEYEGWRKIKRKNIFII